MDSKPDLGYTLDADLFKVLAGGTEDEAVSTLLSEPAIEKLTRKNARLEADSTKVLPESPWYLAVLQVALVGVLAGLLFLSK